MKRVNLKDTLYREGEYLIGFEATGSHACYMLYGVLDRGEEREISPGEGHEEIVCVIEGTAILEFDSSPSTLKKGDGVFLKGKEKIVLKCERGLVIYIIAGGHTDAGHHSH